MVTAAVTLLLTGLAPAGNTLAITLQELLVMSVLLILMVLVVMPVVVVAGH